MARTEQHARPSHKHCKACAKHAHAPYVRSETISNPKTNCLRLIPGIRCPVKQAALFPLIRKTVGISNKEMRIILHRTKNKRDFSWQTTRLNQQNNSNDAVAHIGTISILWNFHTNPYQFSETTSGNNSVTAPVKPQLRQITSCMARQHARPSHKHCKPCAKHAHAPPPRPCTRLHDFHLVEFSHQPVPV